MSGEFEVTDVVPSPVVLTDAANPVPPNVAALGRFVIVGVVGVARPTLKVCALPSAPAEFAPAAT